MQSIFNEVNKFFNVKEVSIEGQCLSIKHSLKINTVIDLSFAENINEIFFYSLNLTDVELVIPDNIKTIHFNNCSIKNVLFRNTENLDNLFFYDSFISGRFIFNKKKEMNNSSKIKFNNVTFEENSLDNNISYLFKNIEIYNSRGFIFSVSTHCNSKINIYDSNFSLIFSNIPTHKDFDLYINSSSEIKNLKICDSFNFDNNIDIKKVKILCKIQHLVPVNNMFYKNQYINEFIYYLVKKKRNSFIESYYNIFLIDDLIKIGCKEYTKDFWDFFFSDECTQRFSTPRDSEIFKLIKKHYEIFKIKNDL